MRQGFTVVREHDVYQGPEVATTSQPVRRQLFNYEDPRFDVRGRGFLGFGTVRMWDADRSAETITTYDNAISDDNGLRLVYPGALKPKTVLRVVPMDAKRHAASRSARLSKASYSYELVRLNLGATYFVHPAAWESLEWEEDVDIDYGDSARIHISGIDGVSEKAALRQRKGSSHYDAYGNEIDALVDTVHGVRAIGQPLRTIHIDYEPTERVYPVETWNDLGQGSWSLYDPARGVVLATEDANGLQEHARYDDVGRLIQAVPEGADTVDLSYETLVTASGAVIGTRVVAASATSSASRTDHDLLGRAVKRGHKGFGGSWVEEATAFNGLGGSSRGRARTSISLPSRPRRSPTTTLIGRC